MPWEQQWVSASADASLPVRDDLPEGVSECPVVMGCREAFGPVAGKLMHFHRCDCCGGWIEGVANLYAENTLGPLCGRQGIAYHCRRCGVEIAFAGIVS